MSDVFLARDTKLELSVVIKRLKPALACVPHFRDRFRLEARATMTLDHPAILRVFGVEEIDGDRPFMVLEALEGESAWDYLNREESMPIGLTLSLARQVASGLACVHRADIIHRDVKPGNLFLVGPIGAPTHVKIIDFGYAKIVEPDPHPWSTNDLIFGTAQYMAPEQVMADPVDARTDVYGLGVTLFRMVTGQLPFDLDPGAELFSHQLFSPAPPPSWLVDDLDPRVEHVIVRCMRKHPKNRYPSMEALIADLEAIASGGRVEAAPLERDPDVYKPCNPKGRTLAETFADCLGLDAPPPASTREIAPRTRDAGPS